MRHPSPLCLLPAVLLGAALLVCLGTVSVPATVEFTCGTGRACNACHEDPSGGGTLTALGTAFAAAGYMPETGRWRSWLRLTLGFLHILTGVLWFGTILYVHLFIGPRAFTGGLPRSERVLGWACILVVGLSGVGLTFLRLPTLADLWNTTFGIVWRVKVFFCLLMVAVASVATTRLNQRCMTFAPCRP